MVLLFRCTFERRSSSWNFRSRPKATDLPSPKERARGKEKEKVLVLTSQRVTKPDLRFDTLFNDIISRGLGQQKYPLTITWQYYHLGIIL
jgi:hypothetical protein